MSCMQLVSPVMFESAAFSLIQVETLSYIWQFFWMMRNKLEHEGHIWKLPFSFSLYLILCAVRSDVQSHFRLPSNSTKVCLSVKVDHISHELFILLTSRLCVLSGPRKCSVAIWTHNMFIINRIRINRWIQWGQGSVPSVFGPSWTCLPLCPQINSVTGSLRPTVGCRFLSCVSPMSDWHRRSRVLQVLISILATTFTESLLVRQFVLQVKAQRLFCCCHVLYSAALQSFYFEMLES